MHVLICQVGRGDWSRALESKLPWHMQRVHTQPGGKFATQMSSKYGRKT